MNELDKIFQSKLKNHTTEYSPQSWDKIQSRLAKQKNKPRPLTWLWMSLASIIFAIAAFLFWPSDSNTNTTLNVDMTNSKIVSHNTQTNHTEEKSSSITTINASTTYGVDNTVQSDRITDKAMNGNADNTKTTIVDIALSEEKQSIKSEITKQKLATIENENLDILLEDKANNRTPITTTRNTTGTSVIDSNLSRNTTQNKVSTEENISGVSKVTESERSATYLANKSITKVRSLRTIGVSSYNKLHSLNEKEGHIALSKSMMDDFRQDCPSFVTDRTGVYLDFYVSHELPISSLSAKSQDLDPYQALRSGTEDPAYSFSAGARLTLMLPNGLGLKTGINYSQVQEKFNYIDPESTEVKEVITITTVDGVEDRDTSTILVPGTRNVVSTNKYRSLDIPLLLSYEWDVRKRTYMTVNGGIFLNLLFKETGKILDPAGEIINLTDNSGDNLGVFKNNLGLSLFGSVGLHYRWSGNLDLILEPNMRLLVKSATLDSYPLDHKWFTAGLITGVRYNF